MGILARDEVDLGDQADVIKRIELVMNYFLAQMDDGTGKSKKYRRMLAMISQEGMEEMKDAPPEAIEYYFKRAAGLIYWSATGEKIINIPWPDDFKTPPELDSANTPQMESMERLSLQPQRWRFHNPTTGQYTETIDREIAASYLENPDWVIR